MRGFFKPLLAVASAAAWSVSNAEASGSSPISPAKDLVVDLKAEWDSVPFKLELLYVFEIIIISIQLNYL